MSGIRAALLALLLVAARQEAGASLDTLIDRLGDDRVEVREAAAAALSRLDLKAIPELQKRLDGLASEPRLRLQEAVQRIQDRFRILDYLPEYHPVSIKLERASPRDALLALREKTGLPLDLDTLPAGRSVTVDLVDQTPLQALHAICRAALIGWEPDGLPDWRGRTRGSSPGRIRFHWVVERYYRPMATAFVRHYFVRATVDDWEQAVNEPQQTISLKVQTAPGVRPYGYSTLKLTALVDDQGNDLLPWVVPIKEGLGRISLYSRGADARVRFNRAAGTRVRVARLAGSMTLRYPKRVHWVTFRPLTPPFGRVEEGLGFRFVLRGYERKALEHRLELDIVSLDPRVNTKTLERGYPFDYAEIDLQTAGGETLAWSGSSGVGSEARMAFTLDFRSKKDEAAVEFRLPWADEFVEDVLAFELRDLRGMNE